jgi:hypothetical protein
MHLISHLLYERHLRFGVQVDQCPLSDNADFHFLSEEIRHRRALKARVHT